MPPDDFMVLEFRNLFTAKTKAAINPMRAAYISAATNRFNQAAAISPKSLIAFGSSNLVALWNVQNDNVTDAGVSETLPGHEGLVTCVSFVSESQLVSADSKGSLKIWKNTNSQWNQNVCVQAHNGSISCICVHGNILVTGSSDELVKIWRLSSTDSLTELQTISLRGKYALALALTYLPDTTDTLILAVAGTDTKINLWLRSNDAFIASDVLSGHEDWIRGLAFRNWDKGQPLVLASGSQDATIRLWNIEVYEREPTEVLDHTAESLSDDLLDAFKASLGDTEEGGKQVSLKRHILKVRGDSGSFLRFSVTFDALLIGHEAGITSLSWQPQQSSSPPTLLSTSTDSSVILWSPSVVTTSSSDESSSIWINRQRFGDIGGQRFGGFVGALWSCEGSDVLSWGWAGGWRRWRCTGHNEQTGEEIWVECNAITGHNGPIKGLDWSPDGEFLISAGLDQTTRIYGAVSHVTRASYWHEIGRPQVHGYDLLDAAFIDPLEFVSIADEKVARVFQASRGFVDVAEGLNIAHFDESQHDRPLGANVPPLGLSNKAVGDTNIPETDSRRPPFEGELASATLWPETEKIFGHGYESITLGISNSRRLIATACKSATPEHAVVRVYDTEKYGLVGQPLQGHTLTVTRVAFSPDDNLVLTVSRDRSWLLFEARDQGYVRVAANKSHGRIIWDCAWTNEGDIFATASRDKTVKLWGRGDKDEWLSIATLRTDFPATAVAFSKGTTEQRRRLAIGLENGEILIYTESLASHTEWELTDKVPSRLAHVDHVHRLAWRPSVGSMNELASCSEDGTLRIIVIQTS